MNSAKSSQLNKCNDSNDTFDSLIKFKNSSTSVLVNVRLIFTFGVNKEDLLIKDGLKYSREFGAV